jgi:hypothetical protein
MSTTDSHNDQPINHEHLAKTFKELITDARKRGQAPPTGEAAIAGMDLIADLYKRYPATAVSAKLAVDLAEVLFYAYPNFTEAYRAAVEQHQR